MKFSLLSSLALLAASAGAASAGGVAPVVVEAPVVVAAPVRATDWTGAYVGLAYGNHDFNANGQSVDESGAGIFAGYNYDFGSYVVGGELSFDRVSTQGVDLDLLRLKGRIGYDAGRVLPYAMLGFAKISADDGTTSVSENGMTYGIGADFALTDHFLLGLELSKSTFTDVLGVSGQDLDVNTFQIRAAYKF